ncbi:hypothetical protein TNCV_1729041 [Trichonephila clavipes]|nr:hypothetical protein TNCV_1729041 [Trichonephila clavipes]
MELYTAIQRDACPNHQASTAMTVNFSDIGVKSYGYRHFRNSGSRSLIQLNRDLRRCSIPVTPRYSEQNGGLVWQSWLFRRPCPGFLSTDPLP